MMLSRMLLAAVLFATVSARHADAITIQDNYLQIAVNDIGTLGNGPGSPTGFKYDQYGTGDFSGSDFFARSPFEGFYITANGGSYEQHSANWVASLGTSSSTFISSSPNSSTPDSAMWASTSLDGTLMVSNSYLIQSNGLPHYVLITTTINNASDTTLADVQFLRTFTPDADGFALPGTSHLIGLFEGACGLGSSTHNAVCLGADLSSGFVPGISAAWSTIPAEYLAGLNDAGTDNAIGLALDIGDLAPHDAVTFQYYYAVATGIPNQAPEPLSIALFGAGLAGVGALRRKKQAR